ncbi:hypothetical protein [Streptomyces sp. CL12-4]|uniref:hypothetical protein n=1 Tax=Streptomyces sp. CL12-4 TaxID=2810306 RepID=UPI001EFBEEE0|nr:hypothetical protein [Streptomyces sp. CL12-4]MCG8969359.1 hypothetical protein [Streptomyces sp. CL12-4]
MQVPTAGAVVLPFFATVNPKLVGVPVEAIGAVGGLAGGVYLRSRAPGLLRPAVLAGLPGPLFRPWSRLHAVSPSPVAGARRGRTAS